MSEPIHALAPLCGSLAASGAADTHVRTLPLGPPKAMASRDSEMNKELDPR